MKRMLKKAGARQRGDRITLRSGRTISLWEFGLWEKLGRKTDRMLDVDVVEVQPEPVPEEDDSEFYHPEPPTETPKRSFWDIFRRRGK